MSTEQGLPDISRSELTEVERRMIDKLSTGRAYSTEELRACLTDRTATDGAVRFHIFNLRTKLRRYGRSIEAKRVNHSTTYYRQVRLLSSHDE